MRLGTFFAIMIALAAYIRAGAIECHDVPEGNKKVACLFLGPTLAGSTSAKQESDSLTPPS